MSTDYEYYFEQVLGYKPYAYQKKVAELLLSGKNVILSVSTGAGKTWASVLPFLYARQENINGFPQKMIFSLPLRTLTNSIYQDVTKLIGLSEISSIHTGEFHNDPFFESTIVFSTIDQTLSNFLCFPLSLSKRQANINAGALIGSYLIFDEFHLLDSQLSMATTLGMIKYLRNLCRVCIMTATLTDEYIQFLQKELGFEIVSLNDFPEDVERIKSLKPRCGKTSKKSISICEGEKINSESIIKRHVDRTIVICNRVETVQMLYKELKNLTKSTETKIVCIHSRFFDSDRKKNEALIKKYFGKDSEIHNVILMSTQVIEAGMDISCDVMHVEISPANSFLQRIGRCARFENEFGEVYVYDVLDMSEKEFISIETEDKEDQKEIRKLNNKYLPYEKDLCEETLACLSKYSFMDGNIANQLVNQVLGDIEKGIVHKIKEELIYNKEKIEQSWNEQHCSSKEGGQGMYRKTIRDIQSIEIILYDIENNRNGKVIPWKYETISVYRWSFIGWVKKMEKINDDDWICAKPEMSKDSCIDFDWQDEDDFFLRHLMLDELKVYYDVVFVDNRYWGYGDAGLVLGMGNPPVISPVKEFIAKDVLAFHYKRDTYYQHVKGLLNCFEREFNPNLKFAYLELDRFWHEKIDWIELIKLIICFHDYGKLNVTWQMIVQKYQKEKHELNPEFVYNPQELLAHTDYNEECDKRLAKPAHAGIGAWAIYEFFISNDFSDDIALVASNVILKHHSLKTDSCDSFKINSIGITEMRRLLNEIGVSGKLVDKGGKESMEDEFTPKQWILYFLLIRILRLCDQKATENVEKYNNL